MVTKHRTWSERSSRSNDRAGRRNEASMVRVGWFLPAMLCACAPAPKTASAPSPPISESPSEGSAIDVANAVTSGEVSLLVETSRLRPHEYSWGITRLAGWAIVSDALGIDPVFDVDRALVSAPRIKSCQSALVLRHHVPDARMRRAFADVVAEKRATWYAPSHATEMGPGPPLLSFPAIRIKVGRHERVVGLVSSGLLVMLPSEEGTSLAKFVGNGRLPPPVADEAWSAWASRSGWSELAPSLSYATEMDGLSMTLALSRDHAFIDVMLYNPTQSGAQEDARLFTEKLDRAVRIPYVGVKLFDPIPFSAVRDRAYGETMLHPSELSWILAFIDHC